MLSLSGGSTGMHGGAGDHGGAGVEPQHAGQDEANGEGGQEDRTQGAGGSIGGNFSRGQEVQSD